jgi:hypothetical protein
MEPFNGSDVHNILNHSGVIIVCLLKAGLGVGFETAPAFSRVGFFFLALSQQRLLRIIQYYSLHHVSAFYRDYHLPFKP